MFDQCTSDDLMCVPANDLIELKSYSKVMIMAYFINVQVQRSSEREGDVRIEGTERCGKLYDIIME